MTKQEKVHETLKNNPRFTAKQISAKTGIKLGTVTSSLSLLIGKKKAYIADHLGPYRSARYVAGVSHKTAPKRTIAERFFNTMIVHPDNSETFIKTERDGRITVRIGSLSITLQKEKWLSILNVLSK